MPLDSTHWWGPDTNFFATRLAQDLFTVQGGIYADPQDPVAIAKFRDGAPWDQEANIKLLREKYVVRVRRQINFSAVLITNSGLESGSSSTCKYHTRYSLLPQLLLRLFLTNLDIWKPRHLGESMLSDRIPIFTLSINRVTKNDLSHLTHVFSILL